ncbi:aldehyde dehydrogenase (NAD+) [Reichenbachiella agariperforans]|uniref:Aldehyde dehydrogenase n=1 Tax=Reichenbachiella agariperforans TaxID=156994 RepID=A0A1M6KUP7_REIAG|nr:aldehyde dehydrogenase family protein [Reichenbachiella agariperforans]SHJ62580.1 aldehyde dehydrogenase (NAD+) [Reichenbachiella agariperforans]
MTSSSIQTLFDSQKNKATALRSAPISERKAQLSKLKRWILDNKSRIYEALYQDLHKPQLEADISEIFPVMAEISHTLQHLSEWTRERRVSSGLTYIGTQGKIKYEPKGRCLIIAPWNYPFQLTVGPLVSCLAAGNTAILKPSENTPTTSRLISEMVRELFDPSWVTVVEGAIDETQTLLSLPFDHIFFTGSTPVGKIVMAAAAKHLTSVTLELGGKSPVIIDESANVDDAAKKIIWGRFTNNGQTCIAPDYLFVHHTQLKNFLASAKKHIRKLFDPSSVGMRQSSGYARIVNPRHTQRIIDLMESALQEGAKIAIGGTYDLESRFIEPTLLVDIPADASIWKEEIFGPVMPIQSYDSLENVIEHIRANDKPLSLYLFSKDRRTQERVTQETTAGSMVINDVVLQYAHPNLPFGGVNQSGIGKAHGHYGFLEFTNQKSVLKQRVGFTNAMLFYPPIGNFKKKVLDFMTRYF